MIPIFKSHFSLGRSILTLEPPDSCEEGGSSSIFKLAKDAGLKEVFLLENNISSFPYAFDVAKKLGIGLRYGEVFDISTTNGTDKFYSKVGIFALNDAGFAELRELHTKVYVEQDGDINFEQLKISSNLGLVIPFYDSFLNANAFTYANFTYDFGSLKPIFFIEDNGLPQDGILREIVMNYAANHGCEIQETRTILYESAEDIDSYMTYRILCNRGDSKGGGSLEKPNIDYFGSNKFNWERFKRENL